MDCSSKDESDIDIVNLIVSNFAHRINDVLASINTRGCRIDQ